MGHLRLSPVTVYEERTRSPVRWAVCWPPQPRIEADEDGAAKALWVQPQIIGEVDKAARPRPGKAARPHPGGCQLDRAEIPGEIRPASILCLLVPDMDRGTYRASPRWSIAADEISGWRAQAEQLAAHGRIEADEEREACERKHDFEDIECGLTQEGACAEAGRCLRCDHFGYGIFRGGRNEKW